MYYENEFIDGLETSKELSISRESYAEVQAKNIAKMLAYDRLYYKQFGVYWWAVKDALRRYVNDGQWYCQKADDPLMKERAWHGSEFRTMLAAMFYMNEKYDFQSGCLWYDRQGEEHEYALFDPDAGF